MPWVVAAAGVAAAGSIGGSMLGASAQQSAAQQEQQAQEQALGFQENVYNNTKQNLQPYVGTGQSALYSLAGLYGLPGANGKVDSQGAQTAFNNFTQLPSYTFGLGQGELAANRSLAASGLTGSGAQAKALTQYGQGYASSQFNNYISTLQSLAGMGQNAAAGLGTQGNAAAGNVGGYLGAYGAAGAAGTIGAAGSTANGIGSALGALTNPNVTNALQNMGSTSYLPESQVNNTTTQYAPIMSTTPVLQ